MKRFISFVVVLTVLFSIVGCAKLVETKYEDVKVIITDSYHRSALVQPIKAGKVMTVITHPAIYRITVKYNGIEYSINGRDTYNKYKDKIGETVSGILEKRIYDNGNISIKITELE
ncbi:MAG: hypothetical protein IKY16_06820 [Bacteroidales bacterium]|nr:hypothetical protein [Bacteroidales bacterium]